MTCLRRFSESSLYSKKSSPSTSEPVVAAQVAAFFAPRVCRTDRVPLQRSLEGLAKAPATRQLEQDTFLR